MVDIAAATRDTWSDPAMDDQRPYGYHTYDDESYPEDEESLIYGDEGHEANPRRGQAAIAMVLAAVFFVFSLFVLATFNIDSGALSGLFDFWSLGTWSWIFFAVMVAFLVWLLVLLLAAPARQDDWYSEEEQAASTHDQPVVAKYADEPGGADTITLRCPKCMNIFSLQDPWTRPFYHVCPHCEARGVYSGVHDPPEVKARLEGHGHGA